MSEQVSSGEHLRTEMYAGELVVCDTCINGLGYNVRWDQAHPDLFEQMNLPAVAVPVVWPTTGKEN